MITRIGMRLRVIMIMIMIMIIRIVIPNVLVGDANTKLHCINGRSASAVHSSPTHPITYV